MINGIGVKLRIVFFLSAHSICNYAYRCSYMYNFVVHVPVLVQVTQVSFFSKLNSVYSELICHQLHLLTNFANFQNERTKQ